MSKKKDAHHESGFETVESALTRTEQYIEENRKSLSIIITLIILVVGGYIAYKKLILGPKEIEAQSQIYRAEQYFEKDSFLLALEGDGDAYGFIDIIDDYSMTETGNLAQYYAGICYLRLGEYENAIEHLKNFDTNDRLVSTIAIGSIGDAYIELDELEKAVSFYEKAVSKNKNDFTTAIYLKKEGLAYEALGNYKKALAAYEQIKREFPNSDEARDIDKYIQVATMKL
ncbi:MAG: tetratricopeptide repeat protein [Bacteroidales bacterium]|nr:tetratricopeptide repeat protein [Bacteroidales bacterium]